MPEARSSVDFASALDTAPVATASAREMRASSPPLVLRGVIHAPVAIPMPPNARLAIDGREFIDFDASGRFEIPWPADRDVFSISADAPTLSDVALAQPRRTEAGSIRMDTIHGGSQFIDGELKLWAQPACIVVGRLSAEPPPWRPANASESVRVRITAAYHWDKHQRTWSGLPGEAFRFERVPLGGSVTLHVEGTTLWVGEQLVADAAPGATLDVGVVGEHAYRLNGQLVDDRGAAVVDGGVRAYAREPGGKLRRLESTRTDDEGRFELPRVPLLPLLFCSARSQGQLESAPVVTTTELLPDRALFDGGVELRLAPRARLAGIVLRPDGSPASGAAIRIVHERARREALELERTSRAGSSTDEAGEFGFDINAGRTELWVWEDRQFQRGPNLSAFVTVVAPNERVVVTLAPIAPLRGRLVLDDGTPWNERWFLEGSCGDGAFDGMRGTFDASAFEHAWLWPGHWRIRARTEQGLTSKLLELDVPADLEREHVLVLQR